jgi:hypothetical protein
MPNKPLLLLALYVVVHSKIFLLGTTVMMVAASCSKPSVMSYKVRNFASDTIRVVSLKQDAIVADTVWIGYSREATIGVIEKGKSHISTYRETGANLTDFVYINVYRQSTGKKARTNMVLVSQWTYNEGSARMADYVTTVTDSNF